MTSTGAVRAMLAKAGWPPADAPARLLSWILVVDTAAVAWSIASFVHDPWRGQRWWIVGLLIVLALAFEEGASRAARLQLRLGSDLKRDMTSVWCVVGAVALSRPAAVVLLSALSVYLWFRQRRPAGQHLYRQMFNWSTTVLACLTANVVLHGSSGAWAGLPAPLAGALPVLLAIVVHTAVNRLLVTVALVLMGVRGPVLAGSREDNLIELATLCLGGLVAVAVIYQPWLAVLVIAPMVTLQRGALVRELEMAATTDSKTGLLNAVAWEQLAQREISRAQRSNAPLAVLIIDIDKFKLVNDRYGHLVGDAVLRGIGRCLSAEVREYDTVARFGGEEFVAVLPGAAETDALITAERLRSRVNDLRVSALIEGMDSDGADVLAISVGVACLAVDGNDLAELLHAADSALYEAKANGRNRVRVAERGPEGTSGRIFRT